jgi:PAS domain S-box-containing protein
MPTDYFNKSARPAWRRYLVAAFLVVGFTTLRVAFLGAMGSNAPFVGFFLAIILAAFYGGFGAGLLATVLAAFAADYFWMEPNGSLKISKTADLIAFALFFVNGALVSWVTEAWLRAQTRARLAEMEGQLAAERQRAMESQLQLAAIVNSSDDAIIGKTREGIITSWNRGAEKMLGYAAAEVIGKSMVLIFPADHLAEERDFLTRVGPGEQPEHFEIEWVRKDKTRLQVSVTRSPIADRSGTFIGVSTIARDITERKRAEAAAQASERRLNFALKASHTGAWDLNLQTHTANRTLIHAQIFGGASATSDWTFEKFIEHVLPEDRAEVIRKVKEATTGQADWSLECRIRRPDGEVRWIFVAGGQDRDTDGKPTHASGIVQDITERKLAAEAVRESEQRFRTMANAVPQLAWMARPDGYITWYNQRWYEYTGTTPEQMEGWGWQRVHAPEALAQVLGEWQTSIATGEPFDMTFPLRGADGVFRRFLTRGVPLKDEHGQVIQWFGTNTDVDALKRAEDEINKLNAELEQRVRDRTAQLEAANKELEAFSYSVSHDLRAPLRGVDSFSRMVLEDYGPRLDDEGRRLLNVVRNESQRMGRLIDDLLAFSRLGRQEMSSAMIDMGALARNVFAGLEATARARVRVFEVKPLPSSMGDSSMMRQVFVNLLANAVKFTGQTPAPAIEIGCFSRDGFNVYYVKDNGAGFDPRFVHKLFGVFQRLHGQAEFEGTGVGLALVQRIVHRHGGKVWAEGKVNAGATFYFALPTPKE